MKFALMRLLERRCSPLFWIASLRREEPPTFRPSHPMHALRLVAPQG
jgi:hypothetical protein